jgi:hypothetical protein
VVDVSLTLFIKVINPNVTPIQFSSTVMDIYYKGTLLGQAQVDSGSQEAKSEQVMEVPAKLDGLKMTNHLKDLFADVTKREMTLNSVVTISGCAVVWKWKHNFEVFLAVHPICMSQLPQAIESARFNKYSILSHIMSISPCTVQYTSVVIQSLIFSLICSTLDCSSG